MALNLTTAEMSDEQEFVYAPLEDLSSHIRLLRILPGDSNIPIRCLLSHATADHNYTCLSYCWGPEEPSYSILVNNRKYGVRSNLYSFLLEARAQGITDSIWIDAICIDQSNYEEKGAQVQMMGTIYAQAAKTIIWCGLSNQQMLQLYQLTCSVMVNWNDSFRAIHLELQHFSQTEPEELMQKFDTIFEELERHIWQVKSKSMSSLSYWAAQKFSKDRKAIWCLLMKYLSLLTSFTTAEYWQRTWIVQELVLSHNPVILAGGQSLPVKTLLNLVDIFRQFLDARDKLRIAESAGAVGKDSRIEGYVDQSRRLSTLRPEVGRMPPAQFSPLGLHRVFQLIHETHCQDARDHAFSLLSLIDEKQRFLVDYNKTKEQVFYDATSAYLRDIFRSSTWQREYSMLEMFADMLYKDLTISMPECELGTLSTIWGQIDRVDWSADIWKSPFWADSVAKQNSSSIPEPGRNHNRDLCFLVELDTACWILIALRMGPPGYRFLYPFDAEALRAWKHVDNVWQPLECDGSSTG